MRCGITVLRRLCILLWLLLIKHTFRGVFALESCSGSDLNLCVDLTNTKQENFTSANAACRLLGSGLINIRDGEQLSFVIGEIRKSTSIGIPFWIGLYYAGDSYQWISGSQAVTYVDVSSHIRRKECFTLTVLDGNKPPIWSSAPCNLQNYYVCGRSAISNPTQSFSASSGLICHMGFELYEGTCVMLMKSPSLSCPQAKQDCTARNAVLTGIPSMIQNDYLSVRIANWSQSAWIGLRRELGVARWQDNSSVTYTNWLPGGRSVDSEASSCTLLHSEASQLGRWEEVLDSRLAGYICESKPVETGASSSESTYSPLTHQGCEPQSYSFQGRCYRVLKSSNVLTFSSACPSHTVPQTSVEWAFTRLVVSRHAGETSSGQTIWTGVSMSFESSQSAASATNTVQLKLHLPRNTSLFYTPTAIDFSQTSFSPSGSYCLVFNRTTAVFFWTVCAAEMPSLCVNPMVPNATHHSSPSTGDRENACPSGWVLWNTTTPRCLSSMNATKSTWFEARDTCRGMVPSGDLVSVHSPDDYGFLVNASKNTPVWLGLRLQLLSGDQVSHLVHWSDRSPVNYLSGQLINRSSVVAKYGEGVEYCVDSVWNASTCFNTYPFFCQRGIGQLVPAPESNSIVLAQPTGDTTRRVCSRTEPSVCFELHSRAASFWSAASQCHRLGRVLATVTSQEQQELVQSLVRQISEPNNTRAYIGLFSEFHMLSWTTGSRAIPVSFWHPRSAHPSNGCTFIDLSDSVKSGDPSTWQTGSCHVPLPFICSTIEQKAVDSSRHEMRIDRLPGGYGCPPGFVQASYNCFSVRAGVEDLYTWSEAAEHCGRVGGTLASVLSSYDQDVLMALLGPQSRSAWIGLRYANNRYSWSRPDPVNFTMLVDDSSLLLYSACGSMQLNPLGYWRTSLCNLHMGYICETSPVPSSTVSRGEVSDSLLQQGDCHSAYRAYRDQCFAVLLPPTPLLSFEAARQLCRGGPAVCQPNSDNWATADCPVVATPHGQGDAAFLRHLVHGRLGSSSSPTALLGLRLNVTSGQERMITEDGQPMATGLVDFSRYQELMSAAGKQGASALCTVVSNSRPDVELVACDSAAALQAVVCSYYQRVHPAHPSRSPTRCSEGWRSAAGGKCYFDFAVTDKRSWREAELACQSAVVDMPISDGGDSRFVGHLVSLHSPEEVEQAFQASDWNADMWIGLKVSYGAMSGGSGSPNRSIHMSWSDNSPVDYIPLHPSDLLVASEESAEKCVQVSVPTQHSFKLTDCNKPSAFRCQLSLGSDGHCPSSLYRHKVQLVSSHTCYHLATAAQSWSEAHATCRGLNPPGHLVSFHSLLELDGLLDLLIESGHRNVDVWVGLYESRFAYRWSDGSPTDFIPVELDESKANRHLLQDCFVLSPSRDGDRPAYFTWLAVNCSEHIAAVVCQPDRSSQRDEKSTTPAVAASTQRSDGTPTPLACPFGYSAFLDRCFTVVNENLLWADADRRCRALAGDSQSAWSGSLARIDSPDLQEFLSSLLDNLPTNDSAAWIGLVRNLTDDRSAYHWSDGGGVSYLRPTFSFGKEPIFDEHSSSRHSVQFCVSLYRSVYPRINGRWLPVSCKTRLPSICQLQPTRHAAVSANPRSVSQPKCPPGFTLSTTGQEKHHSSSLPVCYRLLDNQHYNWESSQKACWNLSTPDYPVTGLVLVSVYEVHFLRAWLSLDPSHGGAGLGNDSNTVWTALQVPSSCPACYANWTWATGWHQPVGEPVRFVDWWTSPGGNDSGCYLFDRDPYSRHVTSPSVDSGLGSLRAAKSCYAALPVVCQAPARLLGEASADSRLLYQLAKPTCPTGDWLAANHVLPQMASQSGKPCLRWDIVIHEHLSDIRLDSGFQRKWMVAASNDVGVRGMWSYAENYCSAVYNESTKNTTFGCYISINPLTFETCNVILCIDKSILNDGRLLSTWQTVILLLLLFLGSLVLFISVWHGCIPLKSVYYRQMVGSGNKRNSTVFFTPDRPAVTIVDTDTGANRASMDRVSYSAHPNGNSSHTLSMKIGGPRHHANDTYGGSVSSDQRSSSVQAPLVKTSFLNSVGFYNPAYTPLKSPSPDDLYDIDEEM